MEIRFKGVRLCATMCLLLIAFRATFSGMGALIMAALANACRPPLFRQQSGQVPAR